MTQAMSRREIEDVLSSIKRLVSQDMQERPERHDLREKLILTSELRVDTASDLSPEKRAASLPAPCTGQRQHAEGSNVAPAFRDPTPCADAVACDASAPTSLLQRITQNRAQTAAPAPIPQPEPTRHTPPEMASPELAAQHIPQSPRPRLNFVEPSAIRDPEPVPEPAVVPQASHGPDPDHDELDIEATLARLEAVLSGQPVAQEPVTAHAAPPKSDPAVEADSEPQAAEPQPTERPVAQSEPFVEGNEIILDEDMLFRLVADIVRLELQGELGEKITRNIRKLVRSEVARELQLRRDQGWNV